MSISRRRTRTTPTVWLPASRMARACTTKRAIIEVTLLSAETARKYRHRQDVLATEREGDRHVVTVRVTGHFPGSPIELRNRFQIRDRKIADLQIG